jgi:hypothetical protein
MYDGRRFLNFLCNGFYVMYDGVEFVYLVPWIMLLKRC